MSIQDASWIWDSGEAAPVNAYRIFRKTFTLPDEVMPEQCIARICADTRYALHVNGRTVARGPAPSAPNLYAYDEIDLRRDLDFGGENVITVIVNYIGAPTFSYYRNRGGLLFQLGELVSDETWLVAKQSPWQVNAPRLTVQQGHCEYYDANKEPFGMYDREGIEPNEWAKAVVVSPAEGGEWKELEPRDIPMAETDYRAIATLIEWGNCAPGAGDTIAGRMTNEVLRPLTRGRVERDELGAITITPDGEDIYLLYDFGEEVSGYIDFDIDAADGAGGRVDIAYDEVLRIGETPSGLKHDWGGASNVRYADQLILRDGEQTFQNFGHRAFRYARLAIRGVKAPITLTSIGIYESTYPVNRRGIFTCSDARLDKIWEIGRRTLQLCMDDRYMDCPWRERAQWVGDAKVEALGAHYCFGDNKLHKRFLRQIALSQYADGHTLPVGPGDWEEHQANPIPGFTAIWIHSIWDYYTLTGDREFCASLQPYALRAIEWLHSQGAGEGGLLTKIPGWNFTDWAPGLSNGNDGLRAPVNLFYLKALRTASALSTLANDSATAASLASQANALAEAFNRLFWNEERNGWADLSEDGHGSETLSQQTNSLAVLYGIGDETRRHDAVSRLLTDPTWTQIGSPYFSYYLLGALFARAQHDEALQYIRRQWGMMLDAGATTWWEEFHGKSSRCHAWSIGPTVDLMTQFLGVEAAEPGFGSVRIAPHLGDLKWAKGVVPTPQGDIAVNWQRTDSGLTLHVSAPRAVSLEITVPASPQDSLRLNGEALSDHQIKSRTNGFAALDTLPGGGYTVETVAAG